MGRKWGNNHGTRGGRAFQVEGTQVQCSWHGHVLGSLREARLAGVIQGDGRQGLWDSCQGKGSPADKGGRTFQREEVVCVGSGGVREDDLIGESKRFGLAVEQVR